MTIEANGGSSPAMRVACPKCGAHPYRYCRRDDGTQQIIAHKVRREASTAAAAAEVHERLLSIGR